MAGCTCTPSAPSARLRSDLAARADPVEEFARVHGPRDEVTLRERVAEREQHFPLRLRLDAFGHRDDAELLRHLEARFQHRTARRLGRGVAHEALVDLELGE